MGLTSDKIAHLRVDYSLKSFDEKDVLTNPFLQFASWFEEAIQAEVNEPNAMTLATVKKDLTPSARIVLLKGFDENGFVFFTNYQSHKGLELSENPNVALVFCWLELQRQVRIEGVASKIPASESDLYFFSRPLASQIGAHASAQSSVIQNRAALENQFTHFENLFKSTPIFRPKEWGGYRIEPQTIEFWQGRQSRLHDRFLFSKNTSGWTSQRLAP